MPPVCSSLGAPRCILSSTFSASCTRARVRVEVELSGAAAGTCDRVLGALGLSAWRAAAGPNSLNWVSASTAPIGALALLLPLHDTLRLLGPAGKLQKLKTFAASKHADKRVYITKKSAFMLRIARVSLLLLDVFFILFGLLMFKSAHDSYKKSQYMDGTETYVIFSTLVGVVLVVVFPILCSGWWLSLKVSLSITNGAINNVVMGVHT